MTLNDIKEELCALGFESEIEADKNLIASVKRALATVYTERGVFKSLTLEHYPTPPSLVFKELTHEPSATESFTLNAEAYCFAVSGKGGFTVEDNGVKTEHKFDTPTHIWRGFINPGAKISFFGELVFKVFNLAVFERRPSDTEEGIFPYGRPFEYLISEITDDFLSFSSLPTSETGREIPGIRLSGETMLVPPEYRGRINLTYKASPPKISLDTADEQLSVPKECEHLIALLSASYYWLDDDSEKASYYLALYRDALKSVKQYDTRRLGEGYKDVTGWA